MTGARLHHVGCLVPAIEPAVESYSLLGFECASVFTITSQKVRVCFLENGTGTVVELVEPAADNRFLGRLLEKGTSFYHLGFLCSDLDSTLRTMVGEGGNILTRFASEAFDGRQCVFVINPLGQMIELIQAAAPAECDAG